MSETLLRRSVLAVRHAVSTDETRFHLNTISIEPLSERGGQAAVATNGHILAAVLQPGFDAEPLRLERADALAIAKAAGAPGKSVSATLAGGTARLTNGISVPAPEPVNAGTFPAWRQLLQSSAPAVRVCVDIAYLETLLKAAKEFHAAEETSGPATVELCIQDGASPMEIRAQSQSSSGASFVALLMPMAANFMGAWEPALTNGQRKAA